MFFIEIKINYKCVTDMCVSAWQRHIIESKKYQHTVISGQHALKSVSSTIFNYTFVPLCLLNERMCLSIAKGYNRIKKTSAYVISGQHALDTVSSLYFCPPQFLRHFLKTQGIQILTDH